jgi:hypothetical protein
MKGKKVDEIRKRRKIWECHKKGKSERNSVEK